MAKKAKPSAKLAAFRVPADRRLVGSSPRRLLAIANKLLGETLIERTPEVHTVLDDRTPVEQIGVHGLRPTWHGRA